jgi:hypothetical protein
MAFKLNSTHERAVLFAIDALCRRWHRFQIKRELRRRYNYDNLTVLKEVIKEAKRRMRIQVKRKLTAHVAESINFYRAVIRSDRSTIREKMLAQERLDNMLGLEGRSDLNNPEPEFDPKVG